MINKIIEESCQIAHIAFSGPDLSLSRVEAAYGRLVGQTGALTQNLTIDTQIWSNTVNVP